MKQLLLPIFGGILLTSSIGLTTGQNINTTIKLKDQKESKTQEFLHQAYSINSENGLDEEQITKLREKSQHWNEEAIDKTLTKVLQYHDNQLTIDKNKLNTTKLPLELLENINLALSNVNNAIISGFIKVNITSNNIVQLIYPNNSNNLKNSNNDIIYFDNITSIDNELSLSTYSSYMWYSTYGPSRWWKFWEWGGYIHFSELAVQNAKWVNIFASLANVYFLFKNIRQISNIIDELRIAANIGNSNEINILLKELSKALGSLNLDLLGNIVEILAILTAAVAFGIALVSATGWLAPFFELIVGIIASVTGQMLNADRGKGVKWQWHNFIIPGGIWAE